MHRSSPREGGRKGTVSRGAGGVVEIATGQSAVQTVTIGNIHLSILVHVHAPDVEQWLVHGVATLGELADMLGRHTFVTQINVNL